jgi:uroporphyrinogen-III decarboxylase
MNWNPVNHALAKVGDDYLLEPWLGVPFFDYIATPREGGLQQGIFDLLENEEFFIPLHEEYIEWMCRIARAAAANTTAESFCIGCAWSCVSLIGPDLWRRWDKPVISAVARELHAAGKLLHIHFHGKSHIVLEDLANCGADCICPFDRAPGGDIHDLSEVRRILNGKVTMNGNVHTVETLIRGTPADVTREVEEIFQQWGPDKRRLILGTGDQVGRETPDENIAAMISAGRRLGIT